MATELEQTLEIDDFFGIDRQVLPEDINPRGLKTLQNLFEKQIGEVQKIGGSTMLLDPLDLPSNITGIDRGFRLIDRDFTKYRVLGIKCTPAASPNTICSDAFLDSVTASYVNAGSGNWNKFAAGVYQGAGHEAIAGERGLVLQFVGYGVSIIALTTPSGASNATLQIVVPAGFNENITGINIYSMTTVDADVTGPSRDVNGVVWAGYIDLLANPSGGTFNFSQAPRYIPGGAVWPAASFDFGVSNPTYDLTGATGGTLTPGKTYYVTVFTQRLKSNYDENVIASSGLDAARWEISSPAVPKAITLKETENAINVDNIAGTSVCYAIAIGTDPELQCMQFITNTVNNTITDYVKSPNVVGMFKGSGANNVAFIAADYSLEDSLIQINDDGSFYPIFISRLTNLNGTMWSCPWAISGGAIQNSIIPSVQKQRRSGANDSLEPGEKLTVGHGSKFRFTQFKSIGYFVNDAEPSAELAPSGSALVNRDISMQNLSGYYMTDGLIAASAIFDYNTPAFPKCKFIATYQESIVVGGGSHSSDSYSTFYFSNALAPHNFAQGGAGSLLDFITIDPNGEPINNISIYTFSTGTDSPTSQLLITKPTSSWALSDLPIDFTSRTIMTNLSKRIGQTGDTIVVTPVGTIWASKENVYIVNPNGEPTPIGDSIEAILRASNLDNAMACYHDNHYKLSFRMASGSGPNDTQLWLDIRKMKAAKGTPFWFGPHTGRSISYSWAEFQSDDTDLRFVSDQATKTVYQTDIVSQNLHMGVNIEAIIETPDYKAEPANLTNKVMNRFYWKAKVMRSTTFQDTTTVMSDSGESTEVQTLTMAPPSSASWVQTSFDYNLFVSAWHKVYPFFYQSRVRGRTFRKKLVHSGADNISISGFALNFKIEKRRL